MVYNESAAESVSTEPDATADPNEGDPSTAGQSFDRTGSDQHEQWAAGSRVRVAGHDAAGKVVEDFGPLPDAADSSVDLGQDMVVRPRRFAVLFDDGALVFCDAADLSAE